MEKYIEREAFLDAIERMKPYQQDADDIAEMLHNFPAADVRPVVRGKWEEDCAGAAICSVCGEFAFETDTHHLCGWFPNFCPNCGAKMEES